MNAMMIDRATVQQAIDALDSSAKTMLSLYGGWRCETTIKKANESAAVLREALAAQQPVPHQQPDGLYIAAVELARQQHARIAELESEAGGYQAELAGYEHTIGHLSALVDELRAQPTANSVEIDGIKTGMELYGWAVTGCMGVYRGDYDKQDSAAMARRCGGAERAFALYREAPKL